MPRKEIPISATCHIYIDGVPTRLDSFTREKQAELMEEVNKKGMEKLGYVPILNDETA